LTFSNTPPRQIKIINSIDRNITVTANGCMDNEPILILSNNENIETIYSYEPEFNGAAIDGFPVKFTVSLDKQSVIAHW